MSDWLAEIKERMRLGVWYDDSCYEPLEWLVGEVEDLRRAVAAGIQAAKDEADEVERLRELLAQLEWAGRDGLWPSCPACNGHQQDGHIGIGPERADCWLAAELRPTDPGP